MVDMTNLTGVDSLQGLAAYTNNMTHQVIFTGGVFVLFFIMLIVLTRNDEPFLNALAASSWSFFTLSLFFWLAHLVPTITPLVFLFGAGISTVILYTSK